MEKNCFYIGLARLLRLPDKLERSRDRSRSAAASLPCPDARSRHTVRHLVGWKTSAGEPIRGTGPDSSPVSYELACGSKEMTAYGRFETRTGHTISR